MPDHELPNQQLFYTIEILDRVIGKGKQVSLQYNEYYTDGQLHDNQRKAVEWLLLSAVTGFGKTVVCSNTIAEKKTSTLFEQWEKALGRFLNIEEELPEYTTKAGRIWKDDGCFNKIHRTCCCFI